ncbi:hypothetical protein ONS95_013900 [Cadophora gregata]|uniref:uncharacterized protein n=1 Tax=Cadophora gregata TaxID=51156 RepID=UPI0026DCA22B|nr:uncharacterized protein ONS95_013900 [Cadophora gregata]KAK0114408.1 hypothetical protein ONS95_013900 [Cadophora gregata]
MMSRSCTRDLPRAHDITCKTGRHAGADSTNRGWPRYEWKTGKEEDATANRKLEPESQEVADTVLKPDQSVRTARISCRYCPTPPAELTCSKSLPGTLPPM